MGWMRFQKAVVLRGSNLFSGKKKGRCEFVSGS